MVAGGKKVIFFQGVLNLYRVFQTSPMTGMFRAITCEVGCFVL